MYQLLSKNWIDAVVVASISDKEVFLKYALESYFRSILGLRYIYIICNNPLCMVLKKRKRSRQKQKFWNRVFIVPEDEEGFSITHHSIFQKDVIELLLHRLQNQTCGFKCSCFNNCPWERLVTIRPFISEYELYLSFIFPVELLFVHYHM